MRHYIIKLIIISRLSLSFVYGQAKPDSALHPKEEGMPVQLYTFIPRLVDVSYSAYMPYKETYTSKAGQNVKTTVDCSSMLFTEITLPVVRTKKKFSLGIAAQYSSFHIPHSGITLNGDPLAHPLSESASYARIKLTVSQGVKIGNRSLFVSGIVSMAGAEFWSPNQYSGILSVMYPWKNTRSTSLSVGLLCQVPFYYFKTKVIPMVIYSQKLRSDLILDILFPARAQLNYLLNENCHLLGGYKFMQYAFPQYYLKDNKLFPKEFELRAQNIALFGSVEYHMVGMLWFSGEMGYRNILNSRIIEPGKNVDNYLFKASYTGSFYGSAGIFIRPSVKKIMEKMRARSNK